MKKLILSLHLLLMACNPTTLLQQGRWNGQGEKPTVEAKGLQAPTVVTGAGERIEFAEQKAGDFLIEKAYLKAIYQGDSPVFQSYSVISEKKIKNLKQRAEHLLRQKDMLLSTFLSQNPYYRNLKLENSPQVIVINVQNQLQAAICGSFAEKSGELLEVCLSRKAKVLRERRLGSGLDQQEAKTLIFPKGPKNSELATAVVSRILVNEGVKSSWVEVNTEGPQKILKTSLLEIQPQDERFDQTQAFFFANQIFAWLKKNQIIDYSIPLKITTQMGYPDKTNTAFYFGGRIRLGTGDDVTYSRIPWDPSIVMHEVSHAVIERIARLPFEGEGGSINEGYADLFASFQLNNPHMGENSYKPAPFRRSADAVMKLSEKNGGLYHDAAIVSGFFWALRAHLPEEKVLLYAVRVLNRLGPDTDFENFKLSLKEQSEALFSGEDLQKVNQLLKERDFE